MRNLFVSFLLMLSVAANAVSKGGIMESPRQRLVVLTDIENEPDDAQSIVRLLLYSNEIDIRGLVATTSTHMRFQVAPQTILNSIEAYAKVRGNLMLHAEGYPDAEALKAVTCAGLPLYGMNGVGKGKDSDGSELIIRELKREDDRPLWVTAWGGTNVLAQALWKLQQTVSQKELLRLVSKLRVYTISDQDDSGSWIRKNFPSVFYIVSPGAYAHATWIGMNCNAPLADNEVVSADWLTRNIQQNHGPLGLCYPDVAYGMEGDTPSFLGLIRNGLNNMEHPDWGSWGGRYELYLPDYNFYGDMKEYTGIPIEQETRPIWTNADDSIVVLKDGKKQSTKGFHETIYRWRTDYQNDFAARMDWSIKPYAEANHNPIAKVSLLTGIAPYGKDNATPQPIKGFTVKSGSVFTLDAAGSYDPDGDAISYDWIVYPEAGTYKKMLQRYDATNMRRFRVQAPVVKKPEMLHIILRVVDKGEPRLATYKRIVIEVKP